MSLAAPRQCSRGGQALQQGIRDLIRGRSARTLQFDDFRPVHDSWSAAIIRTFLKLPEVLATHKDLHGKSRSTTSRSPCFRLVVEAPGVARQQENSPGS